MMPPFQAASRAVEFTPPDDDAAVLVYEKDGVAVTSFRGNHAPIEPAVGYRIAFGGKAIVLSGDTVRTGALLAHSRQANHFFRNPAGKQYSGDIVVGRDGMQIVIPVP
jgi:ribonuclease Z